MLRVALFAGLAEAAGTREIAIPWEGGTAGELKRRVASSLPRIAVLVSQSVVAVGSAYRRDEDGLSAGEPVALIPPVSGG